MTEKFRKAGQKFFSWTNIVAEICITVFRVCSSITPESRRGVKGSGYEIEDGAGGARAGVNDITSTG